MYASSLRRTALGWLTAGLAIASVVGDSRVDFDRSSRIDVISRNDVVSAVLRDLYETSLHTYQKRVDVTWVGVNEVKATNDPNTELWTAGLVTCHGVALTMDPQTEDGPSRVLAHINSETGSVNWRAVIRQVEQAYVQATKRGRLTTKRPKNVRITLSIGKMRNYAHGRTQPGLASGMGSWTYADRWQSCLEDILDRLSRLTDADIDIVERDIVDNVDLTSGQNMMGIKRDKRVSVAPTSGYPDASLVYEPLAHRHETS